MEKDFLAKILKEFERDFYMKIINNYLIVLIIKLLAIIAISLVTSSLSYLFSPFMETKNKNQIFSKLVVW